MRVAANGTKEPTRPVYESMSAGEDLDRQVKAAVEGLPADAVRLDKWWKAKDLGQLADVAMGLANRIVKLNEAIRRVADEQKM